MAGELSFIKAQLWAVIALLIAILVGNLLCNLRHWKGTTAVASEPDFRDLYRRDELDELIGSARAYLQARPNSTDALYWGGLALMARKRHSEAHQ